MSKRLPKRFLAYTLLLATSLLWGLAAPIVKRAYADGLTANAFLLGRYLVAVLTSLPVLFIFKKQISTKRVFKPTTFTKVVLLEIVNIVISLTLLYVGLKHTSATEATLITATYPIFMTLGGLLFLHEVVEGHEWTGLIIALIGTIFLVVDPMINGHLSFNHTLGNILVLTQNIVGAVYYLLIKKAYQPLNKWVVNHISFWVGLVGFAALMIFNGVNPISELTNLVSDHRFWPLFAIVYMGFAGSTLAATFSMIGHDLIEVSEASLFTYLYPLFGIPAAVFLLGEKVSGIEIVAIIVILVGVVLAERRGRQRRI